MKTWAAILALFVMGCSVFTVDPPSEMPSPAPVSSMDRALQATVALVHEDTGRVFCTGVFYNDAIVTAAHCVSESPANMTAVSVFGYENEIGIFSKFWMYHTEYADELQDIAILVQASPEAPVHTNLVLGDEPYRGQTAVSIGHPLGLTYTLTSGVISHPRREENGAVWTQADTKIWFGSSGGPLLNRYAEIIGIASFVAGPVNHLGGFVHVSKIREALERAGVL